jgi:Methyltransferase domain/Glycosyltransferase family 9 (heptosyltransferase)/Glycosyl transferase family 8
MLLINHGPKQYNDHKIGQAFEVPQIEGERILRDFLGSRSFRFEVVDETPGESLDDQLAKCRAQKSSRLLLATISLGPTYKRLSKATGPLMRHYCRRHGIDFFEFTAKDKRLNAYWQRYRIAELLDTYDRIIYADGDVAFMPDAPSLFDVVPEDSVGAFVEGKYPQCTANAERYLTGYATDILGREDTWSADPARYINDGVLVFSRAHAGLFKMPEGDPAHFMCDQLQPGPDYIGGQTNININLADYGFPLFELRPTLLGLTDRCEGLALYKCQIIHWAWGHLDEERLREIEYVCSSRFSERSILAECKTLLITRGPAIGDLLHVTALTRELKRAYPGLRITVATSASHHRLLENQSIDEVIDTGSAVASRYGHHIDIKFPQDLDPQAEKGPWGSKPEVRCFAQYLPEGWEWEIRPEYALHLYETQWAKDQLASFRGEGSGVVLVSTSASCAVRVHPKTTEIIGELIKVGFKVVTVGAPGSFPSSLNLCGKTSLAELAALVKEADLVVTPDTGTLHLSRAIGTPFITYFSTHNPEFVYDDCVGQGFAFTGRGCDRFPCGLYTQGCHYNTSCLSSISPREIAEKCIEFFALGRFIEPKSLPHAMRNVAFRAGLKELAHDLSASFKRSRIRKPTGVEVGSYAGESAAIFAPVFDSLTCVDLWDESLYEGWMPGCQISSPGTVQSSFDARTRMFPQIKKLKSDSREAAKKFRDGSLDALYIDGAHDEANFTADLDAWLPKLKKSGVLAIHDYGNPDCPDVKPTADRILGAPSKVYQDTSAVYFRVAKA